MLQRIYASSIAFFCAFLASPAFAVLDLDAVETDVNANKAVLIALGIVILTLVYAVRAISWARKI